MQYNLDTTDSVLAEIEAREDCMYVLLRAARRDPNSATLAKTIQSFVLAAKTLKRATRDIDIEAVNWVKIANSFYRLIK